MTGSTQNFIKAYIPIFIPKETLKDEELKSDLVLLNLRDAYSSFVKQEYISKRINCTLMKDSLVVATSCHELKKIIEEEVKDKENHLSHVFAVEVSVYQDDVHFNHDLVAIRKHAIVPASRILNLELISGNKRDIGYVKKEFENDLSKNYENVDLTIKKLNHFLHDKEFWRNKNNKVSSLSFPHGITKIQEMIKDPAFSFKKMKKTVWNELPKDNRFGLFKRVYRFIKNYSTSTKDFYKLVLQAENVHDLLKKTEERFGKIDLDRSLDKRADRHAQSGIIKNIRP